VRPLALLAIVLACAGCSAPSFEHPVTAETGPALDPALVGEWRAEADDGLVELLIEPEANAGSMRLAISDEAGDRKTKVSYLTLVTARLERLTYFSVRAHEGADENDLPDGWFYARYEVPAPDTLVVHLADVDAWQTAVNDGRVAGSTTTAAGDRKLTVTASDDELRKFVLGYGSVMFPDAQPLEFHRVVRP